MAAATGATTMQSAIQQQQPGNDMPAAFDAMHGELLEEAHAVATELGADVRTVAFLPDGCGGGDGDGGAKPQAVAHEFIGSPQKMMRQLVAKDVSRMGAVELAQHAARLRTLRAAVVRKLREKEEKKMAATAAAAGGESTVKREPEHQETRAGAGGFTKIRRVE